MVPITICSMVCEPSVSLFLNRSSSTVTTSPTLLGGTFYTRRGDFLTSDGSQKKKDSTSKLLRDRHGTLLVTKKEKQNGECG